MDRARDPGSVTALGGADTLMTTLILFGRPASGKGTLAQRLASDGGYRACSTGQAMREWAAGPSPEQQALRETMATGGYGSDELAVRIVRSFIAAVPDAVTGVILDGFPRDLAQSDAWLETASDPGIGVLVETPDAVCRDRVLGRMVCGACGWTDHAPATRCVRCGETLTRRADDHDAATFDHRMHDHDTRVLPIIAAWSARGLPLIRLDGERDAEINARQLLDQLAPLPAR